MLALLAVGLLGGCVRPPRSAGAGAGAAVAGMAGTHYRLDVQASRLVVRVYRDGPLASLGHNHVLVFPEVSGDIVLPRDRTLAHGELAVAVESVRVDEREARASAGPDFARPVSASDIAGTREHLLGAAQLDAARYPSITVTVEAASGGPEAFVLNVRIVLCGRATEQQLPATARIADGVLTADGEVELRQTALGLQPYTALLGALAVRDAIVLEYHLLARADGAG